MVAIISFLIFGLVSFMRASFSTEADVWTLALPQILQGVAMATFFVPLTTIVLAGVQQDNVPPASGLSNFMRITAGAFGASLTTTLWDSRASLHHAQLAERINAYDPAVVQTIQGLQNLGLNQQEALGLIERQTSTQAYMLSANDLFWLSGVLFLA